MQARPGSSHRNRRQCSRGCRRCAGRALRAVFAHERLHVGLSLVKRDGLAYVAVGQLTGW